MLRLFCAAGGIYRTLEKVKFDAFLWKARTFYFLHVKVGIRGCLFYWKIKHNDDVSPSMIMSNAEHDVCFSMTCNACKRHG